MTVITAQMIKELRDRTGIGIGNCKEALEESKGNVELAIENLRKKGMASAVKKQDREAKEGQIAFAETADAIALAEINAETDFVVRNERFQEFVKSVVEEAAKTNPSSLEAFMDQKYSKDSSITMDQYRATVVQAIGENIQVRRLKIVKKDPAKSIGVYSHLGGKILTLVEISGAGEEALARDIAMHAAAANPEYLDADEVPSEVIEREKEIAKSQMKGKPENIIEKIVSGKMEDFFKQICLKRQSFIKDDSMTIKQLVEKRAKEAGKPLEVVSFLRWTVGQS